MTDNHFYGVIMAGGAGLKPLLDVTYSRMSTIIPKDNLLIATHESNVDAILLQIPGLKATNIITEPYSRGTAPCLAYASHLLQHRDPQAVMVATPADHVINNTESFKESIISALNYASSHQELVTIGVVPTRPDTRFGYIQMSDPTATDGQPVRVKTFTEKPDLQLAEIFVGSGVFLWNTGIFVWKCSTIIEQLHVCAPELMNYWEGLDHKSQFYADCPKTSIDYAVMEKTEIASVIPASFDWEDAELS